MSDHGQQYGTGSDPTSLPLFAGPGPVEAPAAAPSAGSLPPVLPDQLPPTGGAHAAGRRREDTDDSLDWELVHELRVEASNRLTARLEQEGGRVSPGHREELGRAIIQELLASLAAEDISAGRPGQTPEQRDAMAEAIFNALFRLGRLQPLVEDDDVENIIITDHDTVWLEKVDGTLVPGPQVADSDEELIEFLAHLGGDSNRPFNESRPSLHLRLPGGARLAAASWVTAGTSVVIRRHRHQEVTMEEMVRDRGACTQVAASFLAAVVRAGKSIVVSGIQGSGKTTWVRALCSELPPWEAIGTFETEFELHLHQLKDRHKIVHAWEHRPGSGEVGLNGRQAGEFTLEEAIHDSFRFNLTRQIVGEVRGAEVWNMLKAMESGPGSISTTHSRGATHTIEKLVSCAMEMGPHVTRELAVTKLASAIDVVMHLHVEVVPLADGTFRKSRWLEEMVVIQPSHDAAQGYSITQVFRPGPDGHAVASGHVPDELRDDLVRHGFDIDAYHAEADAYGASP